MHRQRAASEWIRWSSDRMESVSEVRVLQASYVIAKDTISVLIMLFY